MNLLETKPEILFIGNQNEYKKISCFIDEEHLSLNILEEFSPGNIKNLKDSPALAIYDIAVGTNHVKTGLEVIKDELRVPVICISDVEDTDIQREAFLLGVEDFISKADAGEKFVERLKSAIDKGLESRKRRKISSRFEKLCNMLRRINQLIFNRRDRQNLVKGVCEILVDAGGYEGAWAVIHGDAGDVGILEASGACKKNQVLYDFFKHKENTAYLQQVTKKNEALIFEENHEKFGCLLCANEGAANKGMLARLETESFFGYLAVMLPEGFEPGFKEKDIFLEIVGNFSFSLQDIRVQEERDRLLNEYRDSEERYRLLLEMSPEPIFVHCEGKVVYINPAGVTLLGADSVDEVIGRPVMSFVYNSSKKLVHNRIERMINEGESVPVVEEKFVKLDGTVFDVEVAAVPIVYNNKPAIQGVVRDITEKKKEEEHLKTVNEELMSFAHVVSHDLKNPLRMIQSYLMILKDDISLFDECYSDVMKASARSIRFIDSLLELARAGKIINEKVDIDLEEIVIEVYSTVLSDDKKTDLFLDDNLPIVRGDPQRLQQVFLNLIKNSIRFMDPDKDRLVIEVSGWNNQDGAILIYKDNGVGIEAKYAGKVFDAGFSTDKDEGTGLGLTITKKIIEAHGGKIKALSDGNGKGMQFEIELPAR